MHACSTWVIMNRETRRLSKIPEEVKRELSPFYIHRIAVASEERDCEKIDKLTDETAETTRSGLAVSYLLHACMHACPNQTLP